MILCDTNVLVALMDRSQALSLRARKDLGRFEKQALAVIPAVLTETLFHLDTRSLRTAFRTWLRSARVESLSLLEQERREDDVLAWMLRYSEHAPDYADGCLCVLSGLIPKAKVWTYDSEFHTIWRRADGSRVPLAVPISR
ncbi:MAG: type II toxin-antitoxin system VapC family toxin [Deltaproteobacteria bacterium]|nr:type II toxin-antitoxin system VapC family toxin [Deltaproteobacteria bacterium]